MVSSSATSVHELLRQEGLHVNVLRGVARIKAAPEHLLTGSSFAMRPIMLIKPKGLEQRTPTPSIYITDTRRRSRVASDAAVPLRNLEQPPGNRPDTELFHPHRRL